MDNIKEILKETNINDNMKKAIDEFNKLTPKEQMELQVKWANDIEGERNLEDGIDCPLCKNRGYITYLKDENGKYYDYIKNCSCFEKRKQIIRAKNSGLGEYLNKRSKDYEAIEDWQVINKQKMIDYCMNDSDSDLWFTALGQSGSGKTLMCSIIANHLLYNCNKNVYYITWTDFISKLKRDVMSDNTQSVSDYLDIIKKADVLFIDELLKKYNETDLKYIIEIINYRYTNNLKTIITSERSLENLLDIDEATFGRVFEKCGDYLIEIPKDRNKNYRLKKLNNKMQI